MFKNKTLLVTGGTGSFGNAGGKPFEPFSEEILDHVAGRAEAACRGEGAREPEPRPVPGGRRTAVPAEADLGLLVEQERAPHQSGAACLPGVREELVRRRRGEAVPVEPLDLGVVLQPLDQESRADAVQAGEADELHRGDRGLTVLEAREEAARHRLGVGGGRPLDLQQREMACFAQRPQIRAETLASATHGRSPAMRTPFTYAVRRGAAPTAGTGALAELQNGAAGARRKGNAGRTRPALPGRRDRIRPGRLR